MVRVGQGFWELLAIILAGLLAISFVFNVYFASFRFTSETYIPFGFSFEWGPESQNIVNGTFRLGVKMWIDGDNVTMVIDANDDDYEDWDYVGLVFDTNQNGYVDLSDESFALFAFNGTVKSHLANHGFLAFVQLPPESGPQNVTFSPVSGYVFAVQFPFTTYRFNWNPAQAIKQGHNQLHICFYDQNAEMMDIGGSGVFTRFVFYHNDV
jgi:hypothetical protein